MNLLPRYIAIFTFAAVAAVVPVSAQDEPVAKNVTPTVSSEAEDKTPPASAKPPVPRANFARVGVQTAVPISLSLDDAIRRALASNNDIEISRDDVRIQETSIRAVQGFYDPVFTVSPTYNRNSSTGQPGTNDFTVNGNAQQSIRPGGGNYNVFLNNTRTENAFSQAQASNGNITGSNSAVFISSLGVRYTQPLFRNFGIDNTRRNLKIARRRLEQTDIEFRRTTIDTIARVQNAYWDLVFALRDQQNQQANVDLSRENLRQIEARISAGASAPLA